MNRELRYGTEIVPIYPTGGRTDNRGEFRGPIALDVWCINNSGGNLSSSRTNGCDVVQLDLTAFTEGPALSIKKPPATAGLPILGVVVEGQGDGTNVANGAKCRVRINGIHEFVKVDGTTPVAAGDYLATHTATAGALQKFATGNYAVAQSLDARSAASIGPQRAMIFNNLGFGTGF